MLLPPQSRPLSVTEPLLCTPDRNGMHGIRTICRYWLRINTYLYSFQLPHPKEA